MPIEGFRPPEKKQRAKKYARVRTYIRRRGERGPDHAGLWRISSRPRQRSERRIIASLVTAGSSPVLLLPLPLLMPLLLLLLLLNRGVQGDNKIAPGGGKSSKTQRCISEDESPAEPGCV